MMIFLQKPKKSLYISISDMGMSLDLMKDTHNYWLPLLDECTEDKIIIQQLKC